MSALFNRGPRSEKIATLEGFKTDTIANDLIIPLFQSMGLRFHEVHPDDPSVLIFEAGSAFGPELTAVCIRASSLSKAGGSDDFERLAKSLSTAASYQAGTSDSVLSPIRIVLISTGVVSNSIVKSINSQFGSGRVLVWSRDDLIHEIDLHLRHVWEDVDIHKYEYLSKLSELLMIDSLPTHTIDGRTNEAFTNAATDKRYVELTATRLTTKPVSRRGKVELVEHVEEISVAALASKKDARLILLGDAGSGKSTGLRRIAYTLAQRGLTGSRNIEIPIYLRAPDIISSGCSSLVGCAEIVSQQMVSAGAPFDRDDLEQGRVRFLVDALDEVAQDADRARVMDVIDTFCTTYPGCKVIITSRNYSTLRDLPGYAKFKPYTIQNISLQQAEKLANNLFKARPDSDLKNLASNVLQRIKDVHGMGLNPLLVAVFVSTADDDRADIPANITELFKKWTEFMLGRWERAKGASKQYQFGVKDFVITQIAFEMHGDNIRSIRLEEFKKKIASLLEKRDLTADIEELTYEIVYRSELFRVMGEAIEFRHHLIQEFFAGRGIPNEDFVKTIIGNDWWRTPIIFYFGEHPENGDALLRALPALETMPADQAVTATVSLGLALQACYLMEAPDRRRVFGRVVELLAQLEDHILEAGADRDERFKTVAIAWYYFVGRDAVALRQLREFGEDIIASTGDLPDAHRDAIKFWIIIGLLETYSFETAAKMIKQYRPGDQRLLLALDMAVAIIGKLRSTSATHQKALKVIREGLVDRIKSIRHTFMKEIRVRLNEERNRLFKKELEAHINQGDEPADSTKEKNESQEQG